MLSREDVLAAFKDHPEAEVKLVGYVSAQVVASKSNFLL